MSLFSFLTGARPPLIRQAVASVDAMLAVSGEMFDAATATLLDNEPMDMDLAARDREVNAREQEVRRLVLEHLAVDPLRERVLSLILVAAVQEAERLGDLAKDLERIAALAERPRLGRHVGPLREARDRIAGMVAAARTAFTGDDAVAAQFVTDEHERIKDLATAYLDAVAHARDLPPNEAVVYALAMRVMSRVSSHLANIVSAVLVPFDQIRRPAA